MKKLTFTISIEAPRHRVWNTLWDDATYRRWTAVYTEGSYAVSDWQEGGRVHFLAPDGNGMYSNIARKIENEFMSFEHLGDIIGGVEGPLESWAGAHEDYSLRETETGTELRVEVDSAPEFEDFFNNNTPKALEIVKKIAEEPPV